MAGAHPATPGRGSGSRSGVDRRGFVGACVGAVGALLFGPVLPEPSAEVFLKTVRVQVSEKLARQMRDPGREFGVLLRLYSEEMREHLEAVGPIVRGVELG